MAQTTDRREGEYLDEARRRQEVAAQKVLADVRQALREAQRLNQTDPAKALEKLKNALSMLEEDTTLSEDRRNALVRMVKDRIRVAALPATPAPERDMRREPGSRRAADGEVRAAEHDRVRQAAKAVRDMRQEGRPEDAERAAAELARQNPTDPAIEGLRRTTAAANQLARERSRRGERDRRLSSGMNEVDRSAMAPSGEVEFPKDWAEKTRRRQKMAEQVTPKERAILRALSSPVSVKYKDSPLEDALEYLATVTNQPILLDRAALKESDVAYDSPVSLQAKGLSVRTVLRKILGEFGLTYVVKDEAIQVTTIVKAREMMIVRTYPVGDIVGNLGGLSNVNGLNLAPGVQAVQMMQNVKQIIELIQTNVEPDSWKINGGAGTIAFNPGTMSLVIKQSAEVHSILGGGIFK